MALSLSVRLLHREPHRVDDEGLQGNVLPVCDHRDYTVRAGLQRIPHELRLPATEVQNPGDAARNGVVDGRHIVIDEEMMMPRAGALIGGRNDLHTGRLERDLHGSAHRGPVGGRGDLHLRRLARLTVGHAGQQDRRAQRERQSWNPESHAPPPLQSPRGIARVGVNDGAKASQSRLVYPRRTAHRTARTRAAASWLCPTIQSVPSTSSETAAAALCSPPSVPRSSIRPSAVRRKARVTGRPRASVAAVWLTPTTQPTSLMSLAPLV